ncbi:hypothetical protein COLU111180_06325 [Cohnella lubricantis]|uniref:Uncharacterized protein n=1 Tax=Cohnella lubricantis TaxID=2163172 RepID=A0A841TBV1_9BACL|nr:hypothetical protein [Cohnella lubricantis]MBB6677505.1 hypothetical protein [Cohnella lubricantis]MBP2116609.1 hypothetical protein [Cohnella lubricantis]
MSKCVICGCTQGDQDVWPDLVKFNADMCTACYSEIIRNAIKEKGGAGKDDQI